MKYYLAIDIGASGGRHMLGHLENGKLVYEEVHRFSNGMVEKKALGFNPSGRTELCWDLDALFNEVLRGMKRCAELEKIPESAGIDTWGVDFVLLDGSGNVIGNTVAYRDSRTKGMDGQVYRCISEDELYRRTGTQKQIYNTIFQLMALKQDGRQYLTQAERLLLIPDYLHYLLTGVMKTEYTNATTTGLVNAETKTWDDTIITACGFPRNIFGDIVPPGTVLGNLTPSVQSQAGYSCKVILPATHDTGSAVMAVPSTGENTLYISSGTWSLMGTERLTPDCSEESRRCNFTNEGGYDYRFRYLKNIMGLWMIQSVKKELNDAYSFAELCALAEKETVPSIVDCNHSRFLSPSSMTREIRQVCEESGQPVPRTPGELAAVVYNSLALCYRDAAEELERISGQSYDTVHIVGGGANADYLNRLTAKHTGKTVLAGPTEATATGNMMAQMIACGKIKSLKDGRECVKRSFEIKEYRFS